MQLHRFLWSYAFEHGRLPAGEHLIPAGPDILSVVGEAFEVDFDVLVRNAPVSDL